MGSKKDRPRNVPILPRGGSVISEMGGATVLDCQTAGIVAATELNAATAGSGLLDRRGSRIVLANTEGDLAELDQHDPLFDQLHTCLRRGFQFRGELQRDGGRTVVDVRPAT